MTFEIKLGPAGTPDNSTLEGISKLKELGLQTMEVQYSHGIGMRVPLAKKVGEEAKKHNIQLSVHAPFFINLASKEKEKIEASKKRILSSCKRMHYMGGGPVVFHPAYFGGMDKEKVFQMTKEAMLDMMKVIKENKWNCQLAPETTGKHSALGSLDETIRLVKETGCYMCIDFAHLYARNYGKINYGEVLDKVKELKFKNIHCHFSGINYTMKGEKNHIIMSKNSPPFEPLAKELMNKKINATIISESPITWKDSLEMKRIFERLKYKF